MRLKPHPVFERDGKDLRARVALPVTTASMAPGGAHANAIKAYYSPQPPIQPPSTAARRYTGGQISSTSTTMRYQR